MSEPPITITEKPDSRALSEDLTGDSDSRELRYIVRGTDNLTSAKTAVKGHAPETFDGLARLSIDCEPVHVVEGQAEGCIIEAVVKYGTKPATGESSYSFDTGGGTQHVTQSKAVIQKYAPSGKNAPDFQGAIGITGKAGEQTVDGVDITVPVYTFSETHYLPNEAVTDAYKGKLFALTGKTNSGGFKGLAAGECLFLGASGSKRGKDDWEITFKFAGSPNVTGLTIGNITGIDKKGWEYLWVLYRDAVDGDAKSLVKKPTAVYVEKVYDEGDFGDLGI